MLDIALLRIGDRVHYQPHYFTHDEWENGIVKEIRDTNLEAVWVVYNCAGNWKHYEKYTSVLTNLRDLKFNWKFK